MGTWVTKLAYRPLSLACSILGGMLAAVVFTKAWGLIGGEGDAPKPTELEHRTRDVLLAAALHGAVFGLVRAAVDRAGAKGYYRLTGNDPNA
jgi:Protein of unknown function (DUF4235)